MNKAAYQCQTDEALLTLIQQRDEAAFDELYRRYDRRLYAYCLAATKNRQVAEDIYQSTLMTVFQKAEQFKGGNFAGWMFTIARNNCLLSVRNQLQTTDIDDAGYALAAPERGPDKDIFFAEALNKAIAALPEEFRAAFELKYRDGFAYHEIAQRLDISMALVKVRIHRAKKMLRTSLQPYLSDEE